MGVRMQSSSSSFSSYLPRTVTRGLAVIGGAFILAACGGGGGSDSNEDNGQQAQPHVPSSTITFFASSLSVDHDCDPNQDNPGDFRIITKVTQDGELIAENSGAATLHARVR